MMTPPPPSQVEFVAPTAIGAASFVVGLLVEVPVLHALLVSGALVAGMAAGTVVRRSPAGCARPERTGEVARWWVAGAVIGVFALALVLDWLDGPGSHPDVGLIAALAAVAGMALGFRPPWQGRHDDGEGE